MAFTALDIIVILLVGAGLVFGWLRGFVGEVLSLFAWFLAIVALRYLHAPVARRCSSGRSAPRSGAAVLAFALVFGLVFLAGKLASRRVGGGCAARWSGRSTGCSAPASARSRG